jgi:hypothetical protein
VVSWEGLEDLGLRVEPIGIWPGPATPDGARVESPFKGTVKVDDGGVTRYRHRKTPFATTVHDLRRELDAVSAREPVLQIAIQPNDLRNDGYPKARAVPRHPGVIVAFNLPALKGQRLTYAVDRFWHWQDNLRAVALGLEALRKVQRYGMGSGYEQYAGYRSLPEVATQTPEEAREALAQVAGVTAWAPNRESDKLTFRTAAKRAQHDEGLMNHVMNAGRTLGVVT